MKILVRSRARARPFPAHPVERAGRRGVLRLLWATALAAATAPAAAQRPARESLPGDEREALRRQLRELHEQRRRAEGYDQGRGERPGRVPERGSDSRADRWSERAPERYRDRAPERGPERGPDPSAQRRFEPERRGRDQRPAGPRLSPEERRELRRELREANRGRGFERGD